MDSHSHIAGFCHTLALLTKVLSTCAYCYRLTFLAHLRRLRGWCVSPFAGILNYTTAVGPLPKIMKCNIGAQQLNYRCTKRDNCNNIRFKMAASSQRITLTFDMLLGMIPVVMDFLDLDSEDVIASGILDDDRLDDAVTAMIMSHKKTGEKAEKSSSIPEPEDLLTDSIEPDAACADEITPKHEHLITFLSRNQMDSFRTDFRMTKGMFEALLKDVMALTSLTRRTEIPPTENASPSSMDPASMLLLTLNFLGNQQPVDQLAAMTDIPEYQFTRVIHETVEALYEMLQHYIIWPENSQVADTTSQFRRRCGLSGVLGTIDVLHVKVKAPIEHRSYYVNQQEETTVILQTVCNDKLRFCHCCTGWPGAMDDDSVLKDSDLFHDVQEQISVYFPSESYLVGDEAYSLSSWLQTPFTDDIQLSTSQKQFNDSCKLVLQNNVLAYKLLMHRFPRLEYVEMKDMQSMVVTILVCCALHNFCLDQGDLVMFEDAEVVIRNISTPSGCENTEMGEIRRQQLLQQLGEQ